MLYKRNFWWRVLEITPGLLSWTALLGPLFLSFSYPWLIAVFVLAFDLYWLFRSARLAVNTVRTYWCMKRAIRTNWHLRLTDSLPTRQDDDALVARRGQAGES